MKVLVRRRRFALACDGMATNRSNFDDALCPKVWDFNAWDTLSRHHLFDYQDTEEVFDAFMKPSLVVFLLRISVRRSGRHRRVGSLPLRTVPIPGKVLPARCLRFRPSDQPDASDPVRHVFPPRALVF